MELNTVHEQIIAIICKLRAKQFQRMLFLFTKGHDNKHCLLGEG